MTEGMNTNIILFIIALVIFNDALIWYLVNLWGIALFFVVVGLAFYLAGVILGAKK